MRSTIFVIITAIVLSCGTRDQVSQRTRDEPNDDARNRGTPPGNDSKTEQASSTNGYETNVTSLWQGSDMRILPPKALASRYQRVFSPNTEGKYDHCVQRDRDRKDGIDGKDLDYNGQFLNLESYCHQVFNHNELRFLGHVGLHTHASIGPVGNDPVTAMTLNSLRALRTMLSRECEVLVERETKVPDEPSNILVRGSQPPHTETIANFYRQILGIKNTEITIEFPAQQLAETAKKILATRKTEAFFKSTIINVCIAVGMDPTIIYY